MQRKEIMSKKRGTPRNFVLRIPNTQEGEEFYQQLRKYLNTNAYGIDRKASGMRPDGNHNTKMVNADSVRIYLQARTPNGLRQVDRKAVQD